MQVSKQEFCDSLADAPGPPVFLLCMAAMARFVHPEMLVVCPEKSKAAAASF